MSRQAVTSYKLLRRRPTVGSHTVGSHTCNVSLFSKSVHWVRCPPPGEAPHAMCQGRVCKGFSICIFNYKGLKAPTGGSQVLYLRSQDRKADLCTMLNPGWAITGNFPPWNTGTPASSRVLSNSSSDTTCRGEVLETCDFSDIWSEWWGNMTYRPNCIFPNCISQTVFLGH